jgi:hyperosmotically inducible periplasmic protein
MNKDRKIKTAMLLMIGAMGLVGCNQAADTTQTAVLPPVTPNNDVTVVPTAPPNNTAINSRDRASDAVTADAQGQGKLDIDITADIRQRIIKDKNMSIAAQNTKIICQSGKVTLRGPVNSQDEKDSIGRIANDVAGASNVDNELEIKPNG